MKLTMKEKLTNVLAQLRYCIFIPSVGPAGAARAKSMIISWRPNEKYICDKL